jgi:predicted amidohydrolase
MVKNQSKDDFTFRVGLCQIYTEEWAVKENLERTLAAIEEAAFQGADLAITPECVIQGYPSRTKNYEQRMREAAVPADGKTLSLLCEKAKRHRMDLVVGFAEPGEGEVIYNSAAMISKEGKIVHLYRKVHCRPFESVNGLGIFTPGEGFYTDDLHYPGGAVKIGTMICFDREVSESVRILRNLGAQFIACPLACHTEDMTRLPHEADNELITRCRAAENEVFIAVVNHAGRSNGGSYVVGPYGEVLHQMGRDAGVAVLEVPVGVVSRHYHGNPLGWMGWGHRRPEIYRKYLS